MIAAYDLDGVLCEPFVSSIRKPWRKMVGPERATRREEQQRFYREAKALFVPAEERFHVITARKLGEAGAPTQAWLKKHFGSRVIHVHMLEVGRTIENVVRFKAEALVTIGATDFTEDNRTVVTALRKVLTVCRVWHFKKGQQILDYEAPL